MRDPGAWTGMVVIGLASALECAKVKLALDLNQKMVGVICQQLLDDQIAEPLVEQVQMRSYEFLKKFG